MINSINSALGWGAVVVAMGLMGCSGQTQRLTSDLASLSVTSSGVASDYAELVETNYEDAIADAQVLQTAIDTFVESPSSANLAAAKSAWLTARNSYGQTEGFRFYQGPIDSDTIGVETRINAWPIDEFYIDYVAGDASAGIVNNPTDFPVISASVLKGVNEQGGEKNISLGYHAIEFLLWGQDRSEGPGGGSRPYTDYIEGGTADHTDRRGQYLKVAAAVLVEDLQTVATQWQAGVPGNYRDQWVKGDPLTALANMMQGITSIAGGELASERIGVALTTQDREDEQSCFSDNTKQDTINNILSVKNVYYGTYTGSSGTYQGRSIRQLAHNVNPTLASQIDAQIDLALSQAQALQDPFDQEFLDANPSGRARLTALVATLKALSVNLTSMTSKVTGKVILTDDD